MNILLYIATFVFLIYNIYIIWKFGMIPSVSDSYNLLEKEKKGKGILFSVMCIIVGGCMMVYLINTLPNNIQFLGFLTGGAMIFVGAAPQFKEELTGSVHYISACILVIASILIVACVSWYILFGWLLYALYTILAIVKNKSNISWIHKYKNTYPMTIIEWVAAGLLLIVCWIFP